MSYLNIITIMLLVSFCDGIKHSKIPDVQFEALKSGGFRAFIPVSNITSFVLNIKFSHKEETRKYTNQPIKEFYVINFDKKLNIQDIVLYDVSVVNNGFHYSKTDLIWKVSDLLDSYESLEECKIAITISNNSNIKCAGKLIIADDFDEPAINEDKWIIEQRIPTYFGNNGNYEFNYYENTNETVFIKNGILHIKPVATDKVRDELDLRKGCTSQDDRQCHYKQKAAYLLPPIKSGKITSKQSFQYGKIKIRAKLPAGDWIIPVLQLQPNTTQFGPPRILIAYSRGNLHLCGAGPNNLGAQLLYGGPVLQLNGTESNRFLQRHFNEVPFSNDFHVYTLEWAQGKMSFYIDSVLYGDVETSQGFPEYNNDWKKADAPFNKEYVLSFGVLVGGIYDFPDECASGNNPKPWNNSESKYVNSFYEGKNLWLDTWIGDKTALEIDYVKVWSL